MGHRRGHEFSWRTPESNISLSEGDFNLAVTKIKPVVEPDGIGNDMGGGRLAGIDVAYKYSFADYIKTGDLTWQYPRLPLSM